MKLAALIALSAAVSLEAEAPSFDDAPYVQELEQDDAIPSQQEDTQWGFFNNRLPKISCRRVKVTDRRPYKVCRKETRRTNLNWFYRPFSPRTRCHMETPPPYRLHCKRL